MTIFQAILLGLVQGLSEFLPISSSGHLVIAPWLFGFRDPGLAFDVALHVGTLLAVSIYFFRDGMNIMGIRSDMPEYTSGSKMFSLLVLGTVPGVLVGFLLEEKAETVFRQPLLVASMLFIFGGILFLIDRSAASHRNISRVTWKDALTIGLAQALAIVPGVSRSGITITAARALQFDRVSAARFSFLLSTPIIFGAAVLHAKEFFAVGTNPVFLAGVVSSAISGYIAIASLIRLVSSASYAVFFWYRESLALLIVLLFFFST
ncbi:MAG: undecaprenyl-diphosphate phosphatase [Candidatus Moraniibacteriota bacterium]|nr:MAG: undecaprenyl-diphosphate phosphatase [Candidatus Moranbacteria bacterium]